jgi:hypothetical protein
LINRFYINHYNNTFLRNLRKKATLPSTSSPLAVVTPGSSDSVALNDVLKRAIVTFLGDLSARQMYASESEDAIKEEMDRIRPELPDLLGGGLRNKALKNLWALEDHNVWEEKIRKLAADIKAFVAFLSLVYFI